MEIIIHRGTKQISGCCTEIRTDKTRIFIDFGKDTDIKNSKHIEIPGLTQGTSRTHAVFFTHYHFDHTGHIEAINHDIPLYIGKNAKEIFRLESIRKNNAEISDKRISEMQTLLPFEKVKIGDIEITPIPCDHSAYDSFMFLVKADGKQVLHTGDFRTHGIRGGELFKNLKAHAQNIDVLIIEGTTLNRKKQQCKSEAEVSKEIKKVLESHKYVFILCSGSNIDRLVSVSKSMPSYKNLYCDIYQKNITDYINSLNNENYNLQNVTLYENQFDDIMKKTGFCMFVRANESIHKEIMDKYKDAVVIYSKWSGYLLQDEYKVFLQNHKRVSIHTSGHADRENIKKVIATVKPKKLMPIHTENPLAFDCICTDLGYLKIKRLSIIDGEIIHL